MDFGHSEQQKSSVSKPDGESIKHVAGLERDRGQQSSYGAEGFTACPHYLTKYVCHEDLPIHNLYPPGK